MIKSFRIMNIRSMNDLPLMERWLLKDHCAEAISSTSPWLSRYHSFRVVPPPPEMYQELKEYGYYNWRVTELWWFNPPDRLNHPWEALAPTMPPEYSQIVGLGNTPEYVPFEWNGQPGGPYPPVTGQVPVNPTDDFLGGKETLGNKTILRWYYALKYPKGVSVEEGEDWFLNVYAKEVMKQPGLTRFFSFRTLPPLPGGRTQTWNRLVEQWYENFDGWKNSVIISPPNYTKPSWAKYDNYPFLEPYVDFVGTFILERPSDNFLRDYKGYITSI